MRNNFYSAAIVVVALQLVCSPLVFALSPSKIELIYDDKAKVLHISLEHITKDPRRHYIRKITVTKNNEKPMEFHYSSQPTTSSLSQDVSIELKAKDTIAVTAICNKAGRKTETLKIK